MIVFTLLVWAVTLAKLPAAWANRRSPATRAYWLAMVALAVCMTLDQPAWYEALGAATGLANIAFPLILASGIAAAFCCQRFLRLAQGQPERPWGSRVRAAAALAIVAVIALGYGPALSHLPNSHDTEHVAPDGAWSLVLRFSLAAWSAFALADIAGACARFARQAESRPLRAGMATAAVGAVLVAGRMVGEYAPLTAKMWFTGRTPLDVTLLRVVNLGALAGFALMALGFGLPALARTGLAGRDWSVDLVHHVRLRRLWRTVRPAVATLEWPRYRLPLLHQLPVFALRGRLYRRVVEIQDGFLALDPYRDAAGWPAGRREQARADARAVRSAAGRFGAGADRPEPARTGADLARLDDVPYLVLVSRYLRR